MLLTKSIVAFLCVFSFNLVISDCYAQKRHLELKSISTNKVRKIKENEYVVIYTESFKVKGLFKILDKKTLKIKGKIIRIEDIIKIQKSSTIEKTKTNKKN